MRLITEFLEGASGMMSMRQDAPTRYFAEAMQRQIDTQGASMVNQLPLEMPSTYTTRNRETSGAVTSS